MVNLGHLDKAVCIQCGKQAYKHKGKIYKLCAECGWCALMELISNMNEITITFDVARLKTARLKYLQLGGEIEDRENYPNLQHSHSKLGIFLAEIFGYDLWKTVDEMAAEDL